MHIPVLLNEVITTLDLQPNDVFLDGTIGFGGHTRAAIDHCPTITAIGIDQDPVAIAHSTQRFGNSVTILNGNFSDARDLLSQINLEKVSKILVDLGISSVQLDSLDRGFSFMHDAPLDMRMNSQAELTAAEWLYTSSEKTMSDAFYYWGDLIHNKKLVESIIQFRRRRTRIERTSELVELVKKSYHFGTRAMMMKTLSQVFQAIRIAVNDEMGALNRFLKSLDDILDIHGRVSIITFHSGEDRLVKQYFKSRPEQYKPINKRVITATDDELRQNLRSKPAKLRVYERIR